MNEYKVGDKVVPHRKSRGCSLEDCPHYIQSQKYGIEYLIVHGVFEYDGLNLWLPEVGGSPSFYATTDILPYEGRKKPLKVENSVVMPAKMFAELLNAGIINEFDEFEFKKVT